MDILVILNASCFPGVLDHESLLGQTGKAHGKQDLLLPHREHASDLSAEMEWLFQPPCAGGSQSSVCRPVCDSSQFYFPFKESSLHLICFILMKQQNSPGSLGS